MPGCACGRQFNGLGNRCPQCAALHTLELEDGATAEDIRAVYLTLAKVWHPDRFESDATLRNKAEEKLKEINAAFHLLNSDGYGKSRTSASNPPPPPQPAKPASGQPRDSRTQDPRSAEKSAQRTMPTQPRQVNQRRPIPEALSLSRRMIRVAIVLAVISLAKYWWQTTRTSPISPPNNTSTSSNTTPVAQPPLVANKKQIAVHARLTPSAPTSSQGYFTVGSTRDEVLAVQGTPTVFSDSAFVYGYSTVFFQSGRVVSWDISSQNPLRVRMQAGQHLSQSRSDDR